MPRSWIDDIVRTCSLVSMLNKRILSGGFSAFALALLGGAFAAPVACSSTAEPITAGSGGSTGSTGSGGSRNTGGSAGSAGSGSTGTGSGSTGSTGTGTTGSGSTGTGSTGTGTTGSTGAGAGGASGGGGSVGAGGNAGSVVGAGGAGGAVAGGYACAGLKPTGATISSLTASTPPNNKFVSEGGTNGGTFTYPTSAITATIAGGNLTATGMVNTYSGVGVYFDMCIDASAYTGVTFRIATTGIPTGGQITFAVQTNSNLPIDAGGMKGACVTTNVLDPYPECHEPITVIPANGVAMIPFSMLMGGVPKPTVTGAEIVGLKWQFPYVAMSATAPATPAYPVNVTISALRFYGGTGAAGGGMPTPGPTDAGSGGG
jgi:hypothetical protein